jgi:hypothetical protein
MISIRVVGLWSGSVMVAVMLVMGVLGSGRCGSFWL